MGCLTRLLHVQLEALIHPFFDELRDPNARLPNGRYLPPLFNFKPHGKSGLEWHCCITVEYILLMLSNSSFLLLKIMHLYWLCMINRVKGSSDGDCAKVDPWACKTAMCLLRTMICLLISLRNSACVLARYKKYTFLLILWMLCMYLLNPYFLIIVSHCHLPGSYCRYWLTSVLPISGTLVHYFGVQKM